MDKKDEPSHNPEGDSYRQKLEAARVLERTEAEAESAVRKKTGFDRLAKAIGLRMVVKRAFRDNNISDPPAQREL